MIEQHVSHYYNLLTNNRISGTPGNCMLQNPLLVDVHSFRIERIILPYTWYPVNSNNNTLIFNPNAGGNVTATVPAGSYTSATFITALQTAMAAVSGGPTYIATISTTTGKITVTQNAGTYTIDQTNSTIKYVMGLDPTGGDSTAAIAYTSTYVINLNGSNSIIVRSKELTKYGTKSLHNGTLSEVVAIIPVDQLWGSVLYFHPDFDVFQYESKRSGNIDLFLTDQYENRIDMNGADWVMVLKFHTSKLSNVDLRHSFNTDNQDFFGALTFSTKN